MHRVIIIFIILVIILILWHLSTESNYVKSNIDQHEYFVMNQSDRQQAADILAQIKKNLITLRNFLIKHQDDPEFVKYRENIQLLSNNLSKINIRENIEPGKYTSYLVNKGDELVMCLRSDKNKKIHDINMLMFVAIHELTHASSDEYILGEEHTKQFSELMAFFLQCAITIGLYTYIDYSKNNKEYCGINVNATPLE